MTTPLDILDDRVALQNKVDAYNNALKQYKLLREATEFADKERNRLRYEMHTLWQKQGYEHGFHVDLNYSPFSDQASLTTRVVPPK